MAKSEVRPIVIKRVKKVAGGHHGGSWKVAFADFATAMMAFFLVMWLVNAATKEQLGAISEYFQNPSMFEGKNPSPSKGMIGDGGASKSIPDQSRMTVPLQPPKNQSDEEARKQAAAAEAKKLKDLQELLEEAIGRSETLAKFKDQLKIDITLEGLRIQIIDQQNRPMFDLGGSKMKDYSSQILKELAPLINGVPNRISISGHTDETAYSGGEAGYTNWELSTDRANAARRMLVGGGLGKDKIAKVVGLGATVPFDAADPRSPTNRRISIVVMNQHAEEQARREAETLQGDGTEAAEATEATPAGGKK